MAVLLLTSTVSATTFSPDAIEATLGVGESITETKTVVTDPTPISKADIVFGFDLTYSMMDEINTVKSEAINITNQIDAIVPDAQYAVISYMDYPSVYDSFGYFRAYGDPDSGDYAYALNQSITGDKTAVSGAINNLSLGYGSDRPQDYSRIFYESYSDSAIGYRDGSKRILINFGDHVPHDNDLNEGVPGKTGTRSTGGDPGRDEVIDETSNPALIGPPYNDDLNLQTVLDDMESNGVTLLQIHSGSFSDMDYWEYWANITGGDAYELGSTNEIVDVISDMVNETVSEIDVLTLSVDPGYESWVTWTPTDYTGVGGDETRTFDVTITVPGGTVHGDYNFNISLLGDGAILGVQNVLIHVDVPMLISCDSFGNPKEQFAAGENVYVKGTGLEPNTEYRLWIQRDVVSEGEVLNVSEDPSGIQELLTTNVNGNLDPALIWVIPSYATPTYDTFDIVADKEGEGASTGYYNSASDLTDSTSVAGFTAPVPELLTSIQLTVGLLALSGYVQWKRRRDTKV